MKIEQVLQQAANPEKATFLSRYFKTGVGQYGANDIFLGITVPQQRQIAKQFYKDFSLQEIQNLLHSQLHEYRQTALLVLNLQFQKADEVLKQTIFEFYLDNLNWVNNWDLVDNSCREIVGKYLLSRDRHILYDLAASGELWRQRIAVVSTYTFILNNDFWDTLKLAKMFLTHKHDLIHKAVGWMLREVGKQNLVVLENFLRDNYRQMLRTMLRYSIEKFAPETRIKILKGLYK